MFGRTSASSSSMATSVMDDTSPESVLGKKSEWGNTSLLQLGHLLNLNHILMSDGAVLILQSHQHFYPSDSQWPEVLCFQVVRLSVSPNLLNMIEDFSILSVPLYLSPDLTSQGILPPKPPSLLSSTSLLFVHGHQLPPCSFPSPPHLSQRGVRPPRGDTPSRRKPRQMCDSF